MKTLADGGSGLCKTHLGDVNRSPPPSPSPGDIKPVKTMRDCCTVGYRHHIGIILFNKPNYYDAGTYLTVGLHVRPHGAESGAGSLSPAGSISVSPLVAAVSAPLRSFVIVLVVVIALAVVVLSVKVVIVIVTVTVSGGAVRRSDQSCRAMSGKEVKGRCEHSCRYVVAERHIY